MQRIDTTNGLFSDGDPANNIKGTRVPAVILTTWQEELANTIEGFGYTLDPAKNNQLLTLLKDKWDSFLGYMPGDEINLTYVPSAQEMLDRGIMERNGDQLLIADYPELYAKIGRTLTPPATDPLYFWLMDDRGIFSRTWDHGAGIDNDAANRTDRGDGTTGDFVGTKQDGSIEEHTHPIPNLPDTGPISNLNYRLRATQTNQEVTLAGVGQTVPVNINKWGGIYY